MRASSQREADAAEELLQVLRAMDSAFSGGDGDAFGGQSQLVVGRLVFFLRHIGSDGWRIRLLMNSHTRPVETVT